MALFWRNIYNREVITGASGEERLLTTLGIAETMRRVILQGYIDIRTTDSAQVDQWIRHGVLSLIQVTSGNPPPAPDPIRIGPHDTRDIVYSQFHQLGFPSILTNTYASPEPPGMIDIDVEVSRGNGVDPISIWWVWGLPNTSVAGVNIGFSRFWARILFEQA